MAGKVNLHTHTRYCKHATGDVRDYCAEAVRQGLDVLGMSDHSPIGDDSPVIGTRMFMHEIPEYRKQIDEARIEFPQLTLLAGFELDFNKKLGVSFYQDHFFGEFAQDYCIGGVHFLGLENGEKVRWLGGVLNNDDLKQIVADSIYLMETGLISYLVHPDMCFMNINGMNDEVKAIYRPLFEASIALDIPLELNANGVRRGQITDPDGNPRWAYPYRPFWEFAAECGIKKVTIGADAHKPEDVYSNTDECMEYIRDFGFELCNRAVVEKILQKKK